MLEKGLLLKITALLVFFLWLAKSLIVDHLEKCGLFSDFKYSFRSSRSTEDLLTIVSDSAFNKSGATRAVAIGISKAGIWHGDLACWYSSQT